MKKFLKIFSIVILSIFALVFLISLIAPPIAHRYIEKHSKDICGRIVTMDKLKVNLFTGKAKIIDFKSLEANDKDTFLTFDTLSVKINLFRLLAKEVCINEIRLITPNVPILQDSSTFNFSDIITHFKKEEPDTTPSQWAINLRNITLRNGHIIYKDIPRETGFNMKELSLFIPGIYFGPQNTNVGLHLKFDDGGALGVKLLYGLNSNTFDLNIDLQNFAISSVEPYLQEFLNINNLDGKLSTQLQIQGNTEHLTDIVAIGNIHLNQVQANNSYEEQIARFDELSIYIDKIDLHSKQFYFDSISINGLNVDYTLLENRNTFSNLLKSQEETSEEVVSESENNSESNDLDFVINNFYLNNASVSYTDATLAHKVEIPINNINIKGENINLETLTKIGITANFNNGGKIIANWKGLLSTNWDSHNLMVHISNFNLSQVSPYCEHYFGYPISDGIFAFSSVFKIKNSNLTSTNEIDIHNCTIERKLKDINPEYNIPLRAGIFVLEDRNKNIQFALPISGKVTSPEFSFRKLIFKAFLNLIVKVATAPIDLLSNTFGLVADDFKDISYNVFDHDFSSEQYEQLKNIALSLQDKENLSLVVDHFVNTEQATKDLALFLAKQNYYFSLYPEKNKQNINAEDIKIISQIKNDNNDFITYLNNVSKTEGDIYQKAFALHSHEQLYSFVQRGIENKELIMKNFFYETYKFSTDKISFNTISNEENTNNKSIKNTFKFTVNNTPTDEIIDSGKE